MPGRTNIHSISHVRAFLNTFHLTVPGKADFANVTDLARRKLNVRARYARRYSYGDAGEFQERSLRCPPLCLLGLARRNSFSLLVSIVSGPARFVGMRRDKLFPVECSPVAN